MSKRKDRERAEATGMHYFNGRLVSITKEKYPGDNHKWDPIFVRCTKCNVTVSEGGAEDHFRKCWGETIPCDSCGEWIPVKGCIEHWKNCKGKEVAK